jgi:hypothetical protein
LRLSASIFLSSRRISSLSAASSRKFLAYSCASLDKKLSLAKLAARSCKPFLWASNYFLLARVVACFCSTSAFSFNTR